MPSDFSCDYCVRIGLSKRTPKADENGVPFSSSAALELYNERRYQHYLDDFADELDLARHLTERVNHFAETAAEEEKSLIKSAGINSNAVTLAWWKRARARDADAAEVAQRPDFEPSYAQAVEWMKLAPAQRFARLKQEIREAFDGRHDVPFMTVTDNAQQLPEEKELTPAQQQSLIEERDRQLGRLEALEPTA